MPGTPASGARMLWGWGALVLVGVVYSLFPLLVPAPSGFSLLPSYTCRGSPPCRPVSPACRMGGCSRRLLSAAPFRGSFPHKICGQNFCTDSPRRFEYMFDTGILYV